MTAWDQNIWLVHPEILLKARRASSVDAHSNIIPDTEGDAVQHFDFMRVITKELPKQAKRIPDK